MKIVANSLALGAGLFIGSQIGLRAGCHFRPHPMPHQFSRFLDSPLRMRYRNPGELLGLFGFEGGMTVLDLGCGTATFTAEMARMVGPEGTVHAVDLQQEMLRIAKQRIAIAGYTDRVHFHHSGAYELPLADDSVDLAVLIAVLAQIPHRLWALAELRRVLRAGGRLAISEEILDPAYVPAGVVRKWLDEAGFRFGGKTGSPFCYSMLSFNSR